MTGITPFSALDQAAAIAQTHNHEESDEVRTERWNHVLSLAITRHGADHDDFVANYWCGVAMHHLGEANAAPWLILFCKNVLEAFGDGTAPRNLDLERLYIEARALTIYSTLTEANFDWHSVQARELEMVRLAWVHDGRLRADTPLVYYRTLAGKLLS